MSLPSGPFESNYGLQASIADRRQIPAIGVRPPGLIETIRPLLKVYVLAEASKGAGSARQRSGPAGVENRGATPFVRAYHPFPALPSNKQQFPAIETPFARAWSQPR